MFLIIFVFFRPEYVLRYHESLNSDTFREADLPQQELHEKSLTEASNSLVEKILPQFVQLLIQREESIQATDLNNYAIDEELHEYGINLRFLGRSF